VQRAAVSFQNREAQVTFDPAALDEARIAAAIERAGYKVAAGGQ
jgi:copper chaperone CopZ